MFLSTVQSLFIVIKLKFKLLILAMCLKKEWLLINFVCLGLMI